MSIQLQIIEHMGNQAKVVKVVNSYDEVTTYINNNFKEYGANVNTQDLKEALDRYYDSAWLYFRLFEVEVKRLRFHK